MKKTVPLVIGMLFGAFALAEFYIPHHQVGALSNEFRSWAAILASSAFIIGGINILQVTWPKIRRREPDWGYKVVLLAGAAVMLLAGLPWHKLGDAPTHPMVTYGPRLPAPAPGEPPAAPAVFVKVPADVTYQIGATVGAGTGRLEVVRVAAPCKLLDDGIAPGARHALRRRAGTVFRALTTGEIAVGDDVQLGGVES